jgi:hypothetical protein
MESFRYVALYLENPLVLIGFVLLLAFSIHRALIRSGIIPPIGQHAGGRAVRALLRYGFWLAALVIILGFGMQFYKTQLAAATPIDVGAVVEKLHRLQRHQLANLEILHHGEIEEWKQQTRGAVEALVSLRGKENGVHSNANARAFDQLEKGDITVAQALFQDVVQRKDAEARAANKEAAEAARHMSVLIFPVDLEKALEAYRRATELDSDIPNRYLQFGRSLARMQGQNGAGTTNQYQSELDSGGSLVTGRYALVGVNPAGDTYTGFVDVTHPGGGPVRAQPD